MSDESDELDEFWTLYAEEGDQALNTVEEALLLLRGQPDDAATVARLFRAMHTFKGGARSMGLTVTEALAHVAEDLIGLVRDEGVQPDESLLALLLRALDALRGMLEWSVSTRSDADPATDEALLEQMKQWRDQAARGERPAAAPIEAEPDADDLFAGWPEAGSPVEPAAAEEAEDDGTVEAIVFEPVEPECLADDPVYREIFAGMAQEALQAMAEALAADPPALQQADEAAERLQHAADQLGMLQWQTALQPLRSHAAAADAAALAAAVGELEALYRRDFAGESPPPAPMEEAPVQAIVFEPVEPECLADDPVYREIFAEMAREALQAMAQALAADPPAVPQVDEAAERLQHAAEQLGMAQWQTALQPLRRHAAAADVAALATAVGELEALYQRDFAAGAASESAGGGNGQRFAERAADSLQTLVLAAELAKGDAESAMEAADSALGALQGLSQDAGYVAFLAMLEHCRERLAAPGFSWESHFPGLLCQLYEELAAVQELAELEGEAFPLNAKGRLRAYCAERVFENLLLLDKLAGDWRGGDAAQRCDQVRGLLKQIHHACGHYGLETAAQLCMALIELFFQVESGGMAADALLLRIVRSFGADMEVLMNAVTAGEEPDTAAIEKLLLDASGVMLESSGTVSSASIEARLGLPKAFHKVLTPESVATALECLEAGQHFYIVRADLNRDEALAEAFLEWMLSGAAKVISNVTVMAEQHTSFDFLLATPLQASALTEALTVLDPSGELLSVQMALADRKSEETAASAAPLDAAEAAGVPGRELPAEVMDSLGELVTAQAMLHHAIGSLAQADVLRQVGKLLAAEPVDKAALTGLLEG